MYFTLLHTTKNTKEHLCSHTISIFSWFFSFDNFPLDWFFSHHGIKELDRIEWVEWILNTSTRPSASNFFLYGWKWRIYKTIFGSDPAYLYNSCLTRRFDQIICILSSDRLLKWQIILGLYDKVRVNEILLCQQEQVVTIWRDATPNTRSLSFSLQSVSLHIELMAQS